MSAFFTSLLTILLGLVVKDVLDLFTAWAAKQIANLKTDATNNQAGQANLNNYNKAVASGDPNAIASTGTSLLNGDNPPKS